MIINVPYALTQRWWVSSRDSNLGIPVADSGDLVNHYAKKDWPPPTNIAPFKALNVLAEPLVERNKIIFNILLW